MIATIIILFWECVKLGFRISCHNREIKIKHNMFTGILIFITNMTLFYFAGLFDKFM